MKLPDNFLKRFCEMTAKTEQEATELFCEIPYKGIRVNTLKSDHETVKNGLNIALEPSPFCTDGYVIPADVKGIGNHPLHHAGAFYVQEPSATSAVTVLDPRPGDKVLDLCAAPGGKSSQIAAALNGTGMLWSNEVVKSRAGALLSNTERLGISNAVISSSFPENLCGSLMGFFDKILVDAPCSGEGMIRHNPMIAQEWNIKNIEMCAERQIKILSSAAGALKSGGRLCYSTCTFAWEENEQVIEAFLKQNKNFKLLNAGVDVDFGTTGLAEHTNTIDPLLVRRVFPYHGGEGHFVALMEKTDGEDGFTETVKPSVDKAVENLFYRFWKDTFEGEPDGTLLLAGDNLYLVPDLAPKLKNGVLRAGLLMGQAVKNRFVPSHALFASAKYRPKQIIDFALDDENLANYLYGLEIDCDEDFSGYVGVRVCGIPLGFGKAGRGKLKNHYPKGLRRLFL